MLAALVPCQPRPSNLSVSKLTWAVGGPPHTYIKEKSTHTHTTPTDTQRDRQTVQNATFTAAAALYLA